MGNEKKCGGGATDSKNMRHVWQDDWEQEFVVNGWMVGSKKLKCSGGMIDVSCLE
jgi:hypothetical protein